MSPVRMKWSALALVPIAAFVAVTSVRLRSAPVVGEGRAYNGNYASTRYSPLDQINKDTVKNLKVVWRQSLTPDAVKEGREGVPPPPADNPPTPLMVVGLVYSSTGIGGVAAVDAATGKVMWHVDAPASTSDAPDATVSDPDSGRLLAGSATRGLAYWTDGRDERIVALIGGRYLTALNAKSGKRYPNFGEGGEVDLRKGQERGVTTFSWRTGPTGIVRGVIVVGSMRGEINSASPVSHKTMPPGDVRGIDVRTGKQLWLWHSIPGPGEVGNETWLDGSWSYSGNTNVWGPMSGDQELGHVYLPE